MCGRDRSVGRGPASPDGFQRPCRLPMAGTGCRQLAADQQRGGGEPAAGSFSAPGRPCGLARSSAAKSADLEDHRPASLDLARSSCKPPLYISYDARVPRLETLGQRIRRLRHDRGMSLAKVSGGDFSRAFLNQVELGRSQPSTRVLRVIAGRLGTEVDYLLEGRLPGMERELAVETARVLVARGHARRALAALGTAVESSEWPLGTDARMCQGAALRMLKRSEEADA